MNWLLRKLPGADHGRVLANASWLYADQAVRAVVVLVVFGLVARALGPENYGVLSYALAFPGLFLPLAVLGLDYVIVRDFVRHPTERDRIFGTALALKLGTALGAFAVAAGSAWLFPVESAAQPLLVVTSLSLLFQPLLTVDFYFQSQVAAKFSVLARLGTCLAANSLRAWFALSGAPVAWFAWAFVVEAALYATLLLVAWRATGVPWRWPGRDWDAGIARRLLAAAWPLLLADAVMICYLKLDQLLLSHFAGPEALGRYAAAFRLAEAAGFFSLALINSYFPRIVQLHHESPAAFRENFDRFFVRMTWFAIAVAVGVSVASPLITRWVLGARFGDVWPVLVALTWANVFVVQIAVRGKWFLAEGMQLHSLACFVAGAAVHLALLPWVAPQWGALGTAVSFGVAHVVMTLVAPALFRRSRPAAVLALRSLWPLKN